MPNQIRLTVLGPRGGGRAGAAGGGDRAPRDCDVIVTAPPGTVLAAIAGGLGAALAAATGPGGEGGGQPASGGETVAVYAGGRRLDPQRQVVGEPPLVDGAVISLHGPADEPASPTPGGLRLEAVAGPDSGGVYLLHAGRVRIGRSAEADVVLDDPDVSRLHCVVAVAADGGVSVADLGSTNGTTVDGVPVGERLAALPPGAALRVGESVLRLCVGARPADERLAPTPEAGLHTGADPGAHTGARPGGHGSYGTHGSGLVPGAATPPPPGGEASATGPGPDGVEQRGRGLAAWARRWGARPGRVDPPHPRAHSATPPAPDAATPHTPRAPHGGPPVGPGLPLPPPSDEPRSGRWPDAAELLLTALDGGPRLWERGPGHPDALTVRLGTAHRAPRHPSGRTSAVPLTVGLREVGSLGLAGPRARLLGLTRSVLAQLTALHPPSALEVVVLAAGRGRRVRDWTWLGWLPHPRPEHGQDCRLLFGFDREQATARTDELVRRLEDGPLGADWATAEPAAVRAAAQAYRGPATVLVVDGDPGAAALRETVARLTATGAAAGVHVLCLTETPPATPSSPVAETLSAAYSAFPAFRGCGAVALLSGAVATAVRLVRRGGDPGGELATVDGVSAAWAQRFARALAPARESSGALPAADRPAAALPSSARLLDELGLARATPAALRARWASVADRSGGAGVVFGAGRRGPVTADLAVDRSHLLVSGTAGSGKTELLCSLAASLCAFDRPDRLALVLVDGRDGGGDGEGRGLMACAELPHATTYLPAGDPVRMRAFAQALSAELKRRAELFNGRAYEEWARANGAGARGYEAGAREAGDAEDPQDRATARIGRQGAARPQPVPGPDSDRGTLRLRPAASRPAANGEVAPVDGPPPRLVVLVDDFDALVDPALGNPGRPAAGSVVRALESVARDGARLGVHLVAATGRPDRTAQTLTDQGAALRVSLDGEPGDEEHQVGRGVLHRPDGTAVPFQGARVTGRIPRTATTRPTVVALDWERAGDPPTRRPVRELGNGPTDLALLASALERATREATAARPPALL
ncbi:FHA domain-containing protein [Streptomyces sp. OF3]|uniref:FHA domain-containing protein n=2 Tax=Streptomyces alkaliterrae TaxID=2213162 RepID=A0A5P0YK84_9ACTN|nr:FHA domain-containing protein [Streptomyces alkaliterrae]MBB1261380.1 FHA domain-containing protein [Streptomyces alkaliterrae]MQS00638.1 FHA domain-containing protein [Streptomyces alkaliterrae]